MAHNHHILRLNSLSVRYGANIALEDVSASIHCGTSTAILGPNGAGKSTLLKAILGMAPSMPGSQILIGDDHVQHQLPRFAYLPQRISIDWDFPLTVREVVMQGRYHHLPFWRMPSQADHKIVDRSLEELSITPLAKRPIRQLSGGQQQRVFLARALAQGADIFLLDEPFSGLDLHATRELIHVLHEWEKQGRTVLAAIHDLEIARGHFTSTLLLNTKLIAQGPSKEVLTEANIEETFHPSAPCIHQGEKR